MYVYCYKVYTGYTYNIPNTYAYGIPMYVSAEKLTPHWKSKGGRTLRKKIFTPFFFGGGVLGHIGTPHNKIFAPPPLAFS